MKKIIGLLFLLPALAHGEPRKVLLEFEYSRNQAEVCRTSDIIFTGQEYLLCDEEFDGDRYLLRVTAETEGQSQIRLSIFADKIGATGETKRIASPRIVVNNGSQSLLMDGEVSASQKNFQSISVKPTFVD